MNKRQFLAILAGGLGTTYFTRFGAVASPAIAPINSESIHTKNQIEVEDVRFRWKHRSARIFGSMRAPTNGWVAVGFNDKPQLKGTRFVIGDVSASPIKVEEHIALVPDHQTVQKLDIEPALNNVSGQNDSGTSRLEFSLPHEFRDKPNLVLRPGSYIHLMLAWSHQGNFDHHSTWRRHYNITL